MAIFSKQTEGLYINTSFQIMFKINQRNRQQNTQRQQTKPDPTPNQKTKDKVVWKPLLS